MKIFRFILPALIALSAFGQSSITIVTNVAGLVALTPVPTRPVVQLLGKTTANDGNGRQVIWSGASTQATNTWDNGGPIASPYGAVAGRWITLTNLTLPVKTSGSGTSGALAKYTGTDTIGNSIITEAGTVDTVAGDLRFSGTTSPGLRLKNLTTTQRDATTPGAGDLVWNTTTTRVNNYTGSAWSDGWVRLAGDTMTGPLGITGGTVTANAPLLDLSQTWNNAAVAFGGINLNITDSAAAAGSYPLAIRQAGTLRIYCTTAGSFYANSLTLGGDVALSRDTANILALRNGANAQTFNTYGTYTDASNYRRLRQTMTTAGAVTIAAEGLGTGATGNTVEFNIDGTDSLRVFSTGAYVKTSQQIGWLSASRLLNSSDGVIRVSNSVGTDFTRLQFGGTTASFPALKRSTNTIQAVLADDSGFAAVQTLYDRFGSGTPEGVVTAPVGATYHRTDGGAGTSLYVKESGAGNTGWVSK